VPRGVQAVCRKGGGPAIRSGNSVPA